MNAAVTNFLFYFLLEFLIRYQFYPGGAIWGYAIMTLSLAGIIFAVNYSQRFRRK